MGFVGAKFVKHFAFAFVIAAALVASPAVGQAVSDPGYDLVDAVKKSDGNKALEVLADHPPGVVNSKDGDGNTALIVAISRSDDQWTGFLLNRGADANLAGKDGETPLIAATRVGFEQAIEWLIGRGAKIDAPNRMGETPLIIAVQQRELPIARVLLSEGADPDKTDNVAGYSARDYAERDPRARDILALINGKKPKSTVAGAAAK